MSTSSRPEGASAIMAALNSIKPGEVVIYHTGSIWYDRRRSDGVKQVAELAWNLYQANQVTLTQRMIDEFTYEYMAVGLND